MQLTNMARSMAGAPPRERNGSWARRPATPSGVRSKHSAADHPDLVVVDADVSNSTRTEWFGKKFPDRFFNIGIAESNLVGIAAGLAASGKTSLIASFAAFITCNAYDQLRMSVAYPHLNVKVVGSHAGISIGEDGASQMGIEDVSLACSLPGFVVIVPADDESAKAATTAMLSYKGRSISAWAVPRCRRSTPAARPHSRSARPTTPRRLRRDHRRQRLDGRPGARRRRDAGRRGDQRPRPRHAHRQADRPRAALEAAAKETGALVVAEEHLAHGGLGSVVAMTLAETTPGPDPLRQPRRPVRRERRTRRAHREVRPHRRQGRRGRQGRRRGEEVSKDRVRGCRDASPHWLSRSFLIGAGTWPHLSW